MYISTKLIPTGTDRPTNHSLLECLVVSCRYGPRRIGVNYRIQLYGYNILSRRAVSCRVVPCSVVSYQCESGFMIK